MTTQPRRTIVNFDVVVTQRGARSIGLRSMSSAAGEAVAEVPIDVDKIRRQSDQLLDGTMTIQDGKSFTNLLGDLLAPAPVLENLRQTVEAAAADEAWTRIRLHTNDTSGGTGLAWLPWELASITWNGQRRPLSLLDRVSLVRHEQLAIARPTYDGSFERLQLMAVVSDAVPTDPDGLPTLAPAARGELDGLRQLLSSPHELVAVPDPVTRRATRDLLSTRTADIVHVAGHGTTGDRSGLIVHGDADEIAVLEALDLLTGDLDRLRLVVLNACDTARRSHDRWTAMAADLVRAGITAVIAMQMPVDDWHALEFVKVLYRELLAGATIDAAVQAGRREISQSQQAHQWAAPVLYCRAESGQIFGTPQHQPAPPGTEHEPSIAGATSTYEPVVRAWNVPHEFLASFVGRAEDLATLAGALGPRTDQAPPVLLLTGLAGAGKTSLAAHHARELHERGDVDIVWWVRSEVSPEVGLAAAAAELGIPESESTAETAQAVRRWLDETDLPWMLVFDNATRRADVVDLLPTRGRGHVVVTSRSSVGWTFRERAVVPRHIGDLDRESAIEFLLGGSGSRDSRSAARIVDLVGSLPMTLGGISAYCDATEAPLSEAAELIERNPLLVLNRSFDADQERPLAAWSLCLGRIDEETALRLLFALRWFESEGIPRSLLVSPDAAAALGTDDEIAVSASLSLLLRYSLVRTEAGRTKLAIHRLLQATAGDLLVDRHADLIDGSLDLAADLIARAWPDDPKLLSNRDRAADLGPHLRSVVRHLLDRGELDDPAVDLARRYVDHLTYTQPGPQTLAFGTEVCERLREAGADPVQRALVHQSLGAQNRSWAQDLVGARATAIEHYTAAIDLLRPLGEPPDLPVVIAQRTMARPGDVTPETLASIEEAVEIADRVLSDDDPRWGRVHLHHASILMSAGRFHEADAEAARGLACVEANWSEPHALLGLAYARRGATAWRAGDYESSESCYSLAFDTTEALGPSDRHPLAPTRRNDLAWIRWLRGRPSEALEHSRRAVEVAIARGSGDMEVSNYLSILGSVLSDLGEVDEAHGLLTRAFDLALRQPGQYPFSRLTHLVRHLRLHGGIDEGIRFADEAMTTTRVGRRIEYRLRFRRERAGLLILAGRVDEAMTELDDLEATFVKLHGPDHPEVARLLVVRATALDGPSAAALARRALAMFEGKVADGNLEVLRAKGLIQPVAGDR